LFFIEIPKETWSSIPSTDQSPSYDIVPDEKTYDKVASIVTPYDKVESIEDNYDNVSVIRKRAVNNDDDYDNVSIVRHQAALKLVSFFIYLFFQSIYYYFCF